MTYLNIIIANSMETENSNYVSKLPNELCQQIFNSQFQLDIGNVSEQLIARTIQLYVQAMSIYTQQIAQNSDNPNFNSQMAQKRRAFYQQKIKKLLTRTDVQKCLVGKKNTKIGIDLQKEIVKINQNAPQQAKYLIQYFKNHHKNQQKLIDKSISQQKQRLEDRIRRRSLSKKKPAQSEQEALNYQSGQHFQNI